MSYLGSWKIDDLLTFPAMTHSPTTGALTDADGNPAYRVYEDETTAAILTGTMAKLDDSNTTGFYSEQITLSAANGFEKGKCYSVYITAAVGAVTGGTFHTFQIEAPVNVTSISGDGAAADNLEATFDGTGYANAKAPATQDMALDDVDIQGAVESAVFDKVAEGSLTFLQLIRGMTAVLLGKSNGLGTATANYRNTADNMNVITAAVDADGNRSAVTRDLDDTP